MSKFFSRITSGSATPEAEPASPASTTKSAPKATTPAPSVAPSMVGSIKGTSSAVGSLSSAVRTKPYTGLEIKTLWNHFQKDDLMTIKEVTALLDRIMIKDATDIYTALKTNKAWNDFTSQALKLLDSSGGGTVDLEEFTSEFNAVYMARVFFVIKLLVPVFLRELRRLCEECQLDPGRMEEAKRILAGIGGEAPTKTVVEEKIVVKEADKKAELEEIKRLKDLLEQLTRDLEMTRSELAVASTSGDAFSQRLREKDLEIAELQRKSKSESDALRQEIDDLKAQADKLRQANTDAQREAKERSARQQAELDGLSNKLMQAQKEMDDTKRSCADRVRALEKDNEKLRENQFKDLAEWKSKFDQAIEENSKGRKLLSDLKEEASKLNAQLLERELSDKRKQSNVSSVSPIHAAALSGITLDPFRSELIKQFGSIEQVMNKRTKLTLNEMELIASSMGYSREYSRKLFYALDVKNRGFLTREQFARPLPLLNDDLCLLTKGLAKAS